MRLKEFILREYSRDITAQKMGAALLQKFQKEPPQWQQRIVNAGAEPQVVLDHLLGRIEVADPTKNKQYVPWIIRMYVNTPHMKFEDAVSKVTDPLSKFFKLVNKKQIPAPNNDIGRIKDLASLVQTVDQFPDVVDQPKNVDRGQAKPYYEDADIRVLIPEDVTAACYYGQGTKWCTAGKENNMFDRYNKQGQMYIILPKKPAYTGEKYQFHFESKQFMDEKDHRVNLKELRVRFPQLADIFAQQAEDNGVISLQKDMDNIDITQVLPLFRNTLNSLVERDSRRVSQEIAREVAAASKVFKGMMDEVRELSDMFMEDDAPIVVSDVVRLVQREGLEILSNEDDLFDMASDLVVNARQQSDLWIYITEVLEDMEDEEGEFDCAMAIDGEITSMIIKLAPDALREAVNSVKRVNEDMSRRGFLGALGAGAMAAGGVQAKAHPQPTAQPVANNPAVDLLMKWAKKFITDPAELAAFMAQCAHESDNFKTMTEYGSAERFAKKYDIQHNPAKAKQLGNDKPGDGIKYRGRGYIQLTGKYNYQKASEWVSKFINHPVDFVAQPDLVATPTAAALSSIWYWKTFVKPRTKSFANTKQVTKNINPGLKGQTSREQKARDWQAALNVMPGKPIKVASK